MEKMIAIASSGGHWIQLKRLTKLFDSYRMTFITTDKSLESHNTYVVRDSNKDTKIKLMITAIQVFYIVLKIRPHVIVTTGAAPGLFAIIIGKLIGARTVWIDSIANGSEMSLAGKKARIWSSLWLTQWPELAGTEPKLKYLGRVI